MWGIISIWLDSFTIWSMELYTAQCPGQSLTSGLSTSQRHSYPLPAASSSATTNTVQETNASCWGGGGHNQRAFLRLGIKAIPCLSDLDEVIAKSGWHPSRAGSSGGAGSWSRWSPLFFSIILNTPPPVSDWQESTAGSISSGRIPQDKCDPEIDLIPVVKMTMIRNWSKLWCLDNEESPCWEPRDLNTHHLVEDNSTY